MQSNRKPTTPMINPRTHLADDAISDQPIAIPADDQNIYLTFGALLRATPAEYSKVNVRTSLDRAAGVLTVTVQATRANTPAETAALVHALATAEDHALAVDVIDAWRASLVAPMYFIADFDVMLADTWIALVPDAPRNEPRS